MAGLTMFILTNHRYDRNMACPMIYLLT